MNPNQVTGQLLVFDPRDPASDTVKLYKIRKSHKKSRAGCGTCKLRRVKCDEARPKCGPCARRQIECSYTSPPTNQSNNRIRLKTDEINLAQHLTVRTRPFKSTPTQDCYNDEFLRMWPTIWPGKATPQVLADDPSAFTSRYDLRILHHLSEGTIGPSLFAEKAPQFHVDVISIGLSNRHVMHALLAASTLHIRFTMHPTLVASTAIDPAPSSLLSCLTTPSGIDPFASIEAGHHLSASQLFRSSLETFHSLAAQAEFNVDALLTTCMLLNMLSFAGLPEAGPPTSRWPFVVPAPNSPTSQRPLNWLRIQLGFGPLLGGLSAQMREGSQWLAFFMTLGHERFYDDRRGTVDIPQPFCEFWGIDSTSDAETHPYLKLVRRLVAILSVWQSVEDAGGGGDRHDEQVLRYFQFMQGVDEGFIVRLEAREVRCLVIYGWFMAVLASARHWWCRVRAVRECEGVVRWLDEWCAGQLDASESLTAMNEVDRVEVRPWLPFMASAVGYTLISGPVRPVVMMV